MNLNMIILRDREEFVVLPLTELPLKNITYEQLRFKGADPNTNQVIWEKSIARIPLFCEVVEYEDLSDEDRAIIAQIMIHYQ
jgi:hypothetical protein